MPYFSSFPISRASVFSMNSVKLIDVYQNFIPDREIKSEVMVNLNVSRETVSKRANEKIFIISESCIDPNT